MFKSKLTLVPTWILILVGGTRSGSADIDFNRDIRPILADNCFHCHGPDEATREADLRLDTEQGAFAARDTIVRGDPAASELISRITHTDGDQRMPPADSKKSLTQEQISLLKDWIRDGAKWDEHWAFKKIRNPKPPQTPAGWVRNEIDQFVWQKLRQNQLRPSPVADKSTLIRRVTFDLTGLPPTLEEIDDFLQDKSDDAYEKVVDRLLQSPHYGERMAQVWLDAARYADSHGYSLDRRRVMWPWRDWVIKAYNENKPFSDFATEQLAGDLLPHATLEQRMATGFNRNHPIQSEGGVINEEYRVETVVDRVETTSAVFLGLTMGCGRCHDHKYEPISQKEFYQFFAFFNNVPETAHVGNSDNQADKPYLKAPPLLAQNSMQALQKRLAAIRTQIQAQPEVERKQVETVWVDDELPVGAVPFGNGGGPQKFLFVTKSNQHPVFSGTRSSFRQSKERGQHGFQGAKSGLKITEHSKLFCHVFVDPKDPPQQIMLQWNTGNSWEHRAYWGMSQIPWGTESTDSRRKIGTLPTAGQWVRLEVPASKVGLVGKQITGWAFTQYGGTVHWDSAGVVQRGTSRLEREAAQIENQIAELRTQSPTVMVMAEMSPRRKTFILNRGQYDAPTEQEVLPAIPQVLGKVPAGQTASRLDFAQWMFSTENPLTARVTVNRYWQMYFGRGIVKTVEDFGTQGTPPSHPELLDWLASRFRESGWDIKSMQKLIVMSSTYRQSSRLTPTLLKLDPKNEMLARGPRFRLPAEAIRDQALAVSQLLVRRIGGPSVRPYQPPGLWDDVVYSNVPRFQQDHGDKLYRRSLYTYWKRSVPPPNLQALDAPSREACTLSRSRTNTPQGVLVLWNDPTFVESARVLAERIVAQKSNDQQSLRKLFRMVTSRAPEKTELDQLQATYNYFLSKFESDPESAQRLVQTGEFPVNKKLNPAKVAAFATIANTLLGLDEVVTKN